MLEENDNVIFYPFSPGVPWRIECGCIKPIVSREVWSTLIVTHPITVLCPGYLLEVLLLPMVNKVLDKYGAKVSNWIVPAYYTDLLSIFKINNHTKDEGPTVFSEFDRLHGVTKLYPSPMFMDRENTIYFNVLFNYGDKVDTKALYADRCYDSFWKQILSNTCSYPYEMAYPFFDKVLLRSRLEKVLRHYGADPNKPYILVDNHYRPYKLADGRIIIPQCLPAHQVRTIGSTLLGKKHQLIVLDSSNDANYGLSNIFKLPAWFRLNSADLFSLLVYAGSVYSSDPNIYMSSALIGCPRIFAGGNFDNGFSLKDVGDITLQKGVKNWIEQDEFDFSDVMRALI